MHILPTINTSKRIAALVELFFGKLSLGRVPRFKTLAQKRHFTCKVCADTGGLNIGIRGRNGIFGVCPLAFPKGEETCRAIAAIVAIASMRLLATLCERCFFAFTVSIPITETVYKGKYRTPQEMFSNIIMQSNNRQIFAGLPISNQIYTKRTIIESADKRIYVGLDADELLPQTYELLNSCI